MTCCTAKAVQQPSLPRRSRERKVTAQHGTPQPAQIRVRSARAISSFTLSRPGPRSAAAPPGRVPLGTQTHPARLASSAPPRPAPSRLYLARTLYRPVPEPAPLGQPVSRDRGPIPDGRRPTLSTTSSFSIPNRPRPMAPEPPGQCEVTSAPDPKPVLAPLGEQGQIPAREVKEALIL